MNYVSGDNGKVELAIQADTNTSPPDPTIINGVMRCPVCLQGIYDREAIKKACRTNLGVQKVAVVSHTPRDSRRYGPFEPLDDAATTAADELCRKMRTEKNVTGISRIPDEPVGTDFEWALTVSLFGLSNWADQFNARQLVSLVTFGELVSKVAEGQQGEYWTAVRDRQALNPDALLDRLADLLWRNRHLAKKENDD